MTRMTGPDCVVMCNLINIYIHTDIHVHIHIYIRGDLKLPQDHRGERGEQNKSLLYCVTISERALQQRPEHRKLPYLSRPIVFFF